VGIGWNRALWLGKIQPPKLADALKGFCNRNALERDHFPWISSAFNHRKSDSLSGTLVAAMSVALS
jgi:hypothetical protein